MLQKRWHVLPFEDMATNTLQSQLKINPSLCKILTQRGYNNFELAQQYFVPSLNALHSPFLMRDMDKAVNRVTQAITENQKILIFGDYDVDGTTAVASMYNFLSVVYKNENLEYYIPHRYREGYGVSQQGIDYAKQSNFNLMICLDCGIKSVELVEYANSLGIDVIICDHHLPGSVIPNAIAVLNPKQQGCNYPFKELCGCGVGFKLMCALSETLHVDNQIAFDQLDLLATAIAADIVPMVGENRILAYHGLSKINKNASTGIAALIKLAGIQTELTINNVVFVIAPRVNAAGRMDDAKKAVQLFIEKEEEPALVLAGMLHTDNVERKEADSSITQQALESLNESSLLQNKKTTVVYNPDWHKGVVGIVASRLIETYHRPTVVLTKSGEYIAGSARSVPGFNLYEAIYACKEYLSAYGGHFAAAGLTMPAENLEKFAQAFEEEVSKTIDPQLLIPEIIIDAEIDFAEITETFYGIVKRMEPFGPENMRPTFITKNVANFGYSKIVKEKHIKFVLKHNESILQGIGFNLAEKFDIVAKGKPFEIVYTIDTNTWNGNTSLQIKVIDLREAS
jgi:single-stranded-DNA-specific exonuclease